MQQDKITVSNALVILSLFFTVLTFFPLWIYQFGMNDDFFKQWIYYMWGVQMFSSQFLHWGILHLIMNSFFILYFGNVVERIIGPERFLLFFILNSIFLWLLLTFLWASNTVGISGFALAIITYYTLHLKSLNNPEYTWWVTAIVINVLVWLSPGISFWWHFGWMLFWGLFWLLNTNFKKK